jgi:peptide/nickel transport system permease protein
MEYRIGMAAQISRYVAQRIGLSLVTAAIVAGIVFVLIRVVPGDAALILTQQNGATDEQLAEIRRSMGSDQPLVVQVFSWIGGFFRGEFGRSYTQGVDAGAVIGPAAANTLLLGACAVVLAIFIGLILGNLATVRSRTVRRAADWVEAILLSAPQYTVALVLMIVFAVLIPVLPSGGLGDATDPADRLRHLILPAIALSLPQGVDRHPPVH